MSIGSFSRSIDRNPTYGFLGSCVALGFGFVLIAEWGPYAGSALLWASACLACGSFIGFLFGIPRVLQHDSPAAPAPATLPPGPASPQPQPANAAPGATQPISAGYSIHVNTNLEQISDWLTKIIVGVTLVQFQRVPDYINRV